MDNWEYPELYCGGHPGSIHIPDNLDISIPCVIGKTALVQEIRHRLTAMGVSTTLHHVSPFFPDFLPDFLILFTLLTIQWWPNEMQLINIKISQQLMLQFE